MKTNSVRGVRKFKLRSNKNFLIGKKGTYSLERKIGDGVLFTLYEGREVHTNKEVMLKTFSAPSNDPNAVELFQEAISQIQNESYLLSTLDFPGIVRHIETFQNHERYFIVEELINGRTLREMNEARMQFSETDVVGYILKILYALNYLHMHGILHRNLSCNNVMITNQGTIKIIGFDIARQIVRSGITGFSEWKVSPIGTPGYCAPEIDQSTNNVAGVILSFSYDIYSIGALMYLILSGTHPPEWFRVTPATIDSALSGKCDAKIVSIVKKSMALDQHDRYQSAFEMITAINGVRGKFIVTDLAEFYDISNCSQATLFSDVNYSAIPGNYLHNFSKIFIPVKNKSMTIGCINFRNHMNQHEFTASNGLTFNIVSKDQEKSGVNKYFLGKTATFWLDEGNKKYRTGVFSYSEV